MSNYFDTLLETISDAEVKTQVQDLAGKVPQLKQWIVDPAAVARADQFARWADEQWDSAHNMTRIEWQQKEKIAALETQVSTLGDGMDLNELNDRLGTFMNEKGLVTKDSFDAAIKAKTDDFTRELDLMGKIATRLPYLNGKHEKEFGEFFDPDEFLVKATEAKATSVDAFYKEFIADKLEAKRTADIDKRIAEAKIEAKREALQERSMAENGQMPTLDGSPEISSFQARVMGMRNQAEGSQVPAEAELGRGQIARIAARQGDMKALTTAVQ